MSHYKIDYKGMPQGEADAKALLDIKEYLSRKQMKAMIDLTKTNATCHQLAFYLSFTGVNGYPIHAFLRTYRPDTYAAWAEEMANEIDHPP